MNKQLTISKQEFKKDTRTKDQPITPPEDFGMTVSLKQPIFDVFSVSVWEPV